MWLPIFKSGRHSSDKGTSRTFTEADLHRMADSYAASGREAPLTIGGRTGTADPAYGWVDRLRVAGGVLEAKLKQVPEQLQAALQGHECRRSVSLFPGDLLRSITVHGVPAPAVPGLEFSDEGAESYDFAEEAEIDVSEIMDRIWAVELTPKQARFVAEYLVDLNATQAAIRAGYSPKTAKVIGAQNLSKLNIQSAIKEAINQQQERTEITADRVIQELFRLASFDPRKLFRSDGTVKNIQELDDDTAACIGGLEVQVSNDGTVTSKVKIWDKNSALEKLGKHFALFTDRVHHSGDLDVANMTEEEIEAEIAKLDREIAEAQAVTGPGERRQ